jgi:hypothetical protein
VELEKACVERLKVKHGKVGCPEKKARRDPAAAGNDD